MASGPVVVGVVAAVVAAVVGTVVGTSEPGPGIASLLQWQHVSFQGTLATRQDPLPGALFAANG